MRDEALMLNEQIIDIHNEQAVCAEKFATTMAENVLLGDALKSVATRRNYCLEDNEHGETWFIYDPLDGTFAPYIAAEIALNSTPQTTKLTAVLDAVTRVSKYDWSMPDIVDALGEPAYDDICDLCEAVRAMEE